MPTVHRFLAGRTSGDSTERLEPLVCLELVMPDDMVHLGSGIVLGSLGNDHRSPPVRIFVSSNWIILSRVSRENARRGSEEIHNETTFRIQMSTHMMKATLDIGQREQMRERVVREDDQRELSAERIASAVRLYELKRNATVTRIAICFLQHF